MELRRSLKTEDFYGPDLIATRLSVLNKDATIAGKRPVSIFAIGGACFICALKGHNFEHCNKTWPVSCYFCGSVGHVELVCPKNEAFLRRYGEPSNHFYNNFVPANVYDMNFPSLPVLSTTTFTLRSICSINFVIFISSELKI